MNPYVFFVGCPRSGTTLLRRIGDAHPGLAIVREQHWLPRFWERRIGVTPQGLVTRDLLDALLADRRFALLELPLHRVEELIDDRPPIHYARFVSELFDLYGETQQKSRVGDKTPKYVRHLPTLHELWPDARVVHLIRDGREVALSLRNWRGNERAAGRFPTWSEDPVTTSALFWEWNVRLGREAAGLLGPERYYELRYDRLVGDPEGECKKLCDFLALPYDPAMLRFHVGRTKSDPGLSARKAWKPVTAGLRDWRTQMPAADARHFEAASGALLGELGYTHADGQPSDQELEVAARLRDDFADLLRSRRWPVPQAWTQMAEVAR